MLNKLNPYRSSADYVTCEISMREKRTRKSRIQETHIFTSSLELFNEICRGQDFNVTEWCCLLAKVVVYLVSLLESKACVRKCLLLLTVQNINKIEMTPVKRRLYRFSPCV
jgi:hypothetical protein